MIKQLTLFFTDGISLEVWTKKGMINRELTLYRHLHSMGIIVNLITYGGIEDLSIAKRYPFVNVYCNKYGLPAFLYRIILPIIFFKPLIRSDLYKTNQISGSFVAVIISMIFQKKIIVRLGYSLSDFIKEEYGEKSKLYDRIIKLERFVFKKANRIVVTTFDMANKIASKYAVGTPSVIPNYVDCTKFKMLEGIEKKYDVIFIGRLEPQKNLESLLIALMEINCNALIIGSGSMGSYLKDKFNSKSIRWINSVDNDELPLYLNMSKIYVLPSFYEGHPKTAIEAMACGLPVLLSNKPGLGNLIENNADGILCDTNPESIKQGIELLLADDAKRRELGLAANKTAVEKYSIENVVLKEYGIYNSI